MHLETVPKPVCDRKECGKSATVQVVDDDGTVKGRFCQQHGMSALRSSERAEK